MNAGGLVVVLLVMSAIGCVLVGGGAVEFLGLVLANIDRIVVSLVQATIAGVL